MRAPRDDKATFVADGAQRYAETPAYQAAARKIEAEVTAAYADRIRLASRFSRILLHFARRREIRRRVAQLTPPEALHVSAAP